MNSIKRLMTTFVLGTIMSSVIVVQSEAAAEKRVAGQPVVLLAGPPGAPSFVRPPIPRVAQPEAASFVVTYTGLNAAAKAAFQRAINIWSTQLSSS